jgi:zinc finger HIT domain-containing protein 1
MSSAIPKTRHGGRNKRFSAAVRKVDENKRRAVIEEKLRYLEEDFFEDPNKMAELDDDDGFEVGEGEPRKHKNEKRVNKRAKKEGHLKRNLNLRKIIQEEGLEEKVEPNFCNIKVGRPRYPSRKYCSICGNLSRSSCPRCGERICQLKCFRIHSEIKCLNFEIQY